MIHPRDLIILVMIIVLLSLTGIMVHLHHVVWAVGFGGLCLGVPLTMIIVTIFEEYEERYKNV